MVHLKIRVQEQIFNNQKIVQQQSLQKGFDKGSGLPSIAIQPIIPADHKGRLFLKSVATLELC